MKIRIKGNYVRYRLTKSDMEQLLNDGYLEEIIEFAGAPLTYALQGDHGEQLTAAFDGRRILLTIPQTMIVELYDTDRVGFENSDGKLHLLIEKDFVCLDNVEEDQSDNYPHPLAENGYETRC